MIVTGCPCLVICVYLERSRLTTALKWELLPPPPSQSRLGQIAISYPEVESCLPDFKSVVI